MVIHNMGYFIIIIIILSLLLHSSSQLLRDTESEAAALVLDGNLFINHVAVAGIPK